MDVLYVNATSAPNDLFPLLVRQLRPRGIRYSFCTFDDGGPASAWAESEGVPTHQLGPITPASVPSAARRLRRLVRSSRPDVVHANLFLPGLATELARLAGGPPSVFTRHHDRSHYVLDRPVHRAVDRWTARRATCVVAPSRSVLATLVEEGVDESRVAVVPHGVDWDRYRPDPERSAAWRAELGAGPIALTAARLDAIKGFDDLFAAVARARRDVPDLLLVVAGSGGEAGRARVEALAAEAGVTDAVRLVGYVDDLPSLVAVASVYTQASRSESFGLSVLEAAGRGVPLAVTTPGGTAEIVEGLQPRIPPGDRDALAARLVAALTDSAIASLATTSAPDVRARFSPAAMASGHELAYRRVLGRTV